MPVTYTGGTAPPAPITTRPGPDVVLVLLDDVGFADLGCYGAEINTPNLDTLAKAGLRYNNFHTTTLCSPSRASILTGRNHHSVGMRMLTSVDTGWPNSRGYIRHEAALISEVLQQAGYDTFAVGKWHVAPTHQVSPAGPFGQWPLGRGFNRFYGFMNGSSDHFYPELIQDNQPVEPPAKPEDGYHLTDDLVDTSRRYIADHIAHRPATPYFLYLPLGAAHSPHHAPASYMEAVRGRYEAGWHVLREERFARQLELGIIPSGTKLPPENPGVPHWNELTSDERMVSARLMEAYAAFLEHTDAALGRLFDFLHRVDRWDSTLIIVASDNGAAPEGGRIGAFTRINFFNALEDEAASSILGRLDEIGGERSDNVYGFGWAQASNTPLRWYKTHTYGGGVRDPLIISYPGHIPDPGAVRPQFHHIVDIAPTIYELVGVEPLESYRGTRQMPIHGVSMGYSLSQPKASTPKTRQYFEMSGQRGIWVDGWKAVTFHSKGDLYREEHWELFHLDSDFSESTDLSDEYPEKLRELVDLWWYEAGKHGVLPLDDRGSELFSAGPPEGSDHRRERFDYFPPVSHIENSVSPPIEHASWTIEAVLHGPMSGVVVAYGNISSGFTLYVADGVATFEYNGAGDLATASIPLPDSEKVTLRFEFEKGTDSQSRARIGVNDTWGVWVPVITTLRFLALAGLDIGRDSLSPVSDSYVGEFPFEGEIERVTFLLRDMPDDWIPILDD